MTETMELPFDTPTTTPISRNPNPCVRAFGFGEPGVKCKTCVMLYSKKFSKTYHKCQLRTETAGPGSDHRVNWDACAKYEKYEEPK